MAEPTVADRTGGGATQQGTTGTGLDAPVAGGTLLLTLYGALVIFGDLFFGAELVPHSGFAVVGIMIGCLIVGAVLGALAGARSDR